MTEALHRQSFRVHSYEVDAAGRLAPRILCAYLQEAAGGDADRAGYTMERLARDGLVWVIRWMRVEVARYPPRGETLVVTTWARRFERALAWREYEAHDAGGVRVAVGTSRWAVVDGTARRRTEGRRGRLEGPCRRGLCGPGRDFRWRLTKASRGTTSQRRSLGGEG